MGGIYTPSGRDAAWVGYAEFVDCGGACSIYQCRCLDGDCSLRWNGEYFLSLVDGVGWVRYMGSVLEVFAASVE